MDNLTQLQTLYDKARTQNSWAKWPRMVTLCKRILKHYQPLSAGGKDNSKDLWDASMAIILREEKQKRMG